MIVDSPFVIELARGAERRIMQDGDSQLVIPPTVIPGLDVLSPHQIALGTGIFNNSSATGMNNFTRNNAAGNSLAIMSLVPGLYKLTCNLSGRFNYQSPAGSATADVILRIINTPGLTLAFHILSQYAEIGPFAQKIEQELLLTERFLVQVVVAATGLTDIMDINACVNAVRRL